MTEYVETDRFRGARFRGCDLREVKAVDSWLVDVRMSGEVRNFFVNDVDVSEFVAAELDRRHPERVQWRTMRTADDQRAMWDTIERLWPPAVARAEPYPDERVDDEWSFSETLRHLVFATDAWASRTVLDEPAPFHRVGLPQTGYPAEDTARLGMEVGVRPPFDEVVAVRAGRMSVVRRIVDGLTDAELTRPCTRSPAPGYPEKPLTVGHCLRVVMKEECEHYRYAVRDLAALERRRNGRDGTKHNKSRPPRE